MEPFPEDMRRFLETNIEVVDQLEILRVLGASPEREWRPADLAREVQSPPEAIVPHVSALHGRGLLVKFTRGADVYCRYGPNTPELEAKVRRLLQLYQERPVTMINMVYARARDALRTFSDAFRLRKEG